MEPMSEGTELRSWRKKPRPRRNRGSMRARIEEAVLSGDDVADAAAGVHETAAEAVGALQAAARDLDLQIPSVPGSASM